MAMHVRFYGFVLVLGCAFLLLPNPAYCDKDDDMLLQGINSYRQSLGVTALSKNDKAGCLAEKIADQYDDDKAPCVMTGPLPTSAGTNRQIRDYQKLLDDCKIDANTTIDGTILPVCVPKLTPTLVLTNYTHTKYAQYVNDSKYTGVGLGSEDDWMVMVLTTSTVTGSFVSGAISVFKVGLGQSLVYLLFSMVLVIFSY